jgi:hypothetical protein
MLHAQLDDNNIVIAISDLHSDESHLDHMVLVDSFDLSLLGKKYDPATNTFIDIPLTLDQTKESKNKELDKAYEESFTVFQSSTLGEVKTYPINVEARGKFEELQQRLIADSDKNSFYFYTIEDANLVEHTRSQFLKLLDDAELFEVQQHIKLNNLKAQVNDPATDTLDKVNAITWG